MDAEIHPSKSWKQPKAWLVNKVRRLHLSNSQWGRLDGRPPKVSSSSSSSSSGGGIQSYDRNGKIALLQRKFGTPCGWSPILETSFWGHVEAAGLLSFHPLFSSSWRINKFPPLSCEVMNSLACFRTKRSEFVLTFVFWWSEFSVKTTMIAVLFCSVQPCGDCRG